LRLQRLRARAAIPGAPVDRDDRPPLLAGAVAEGARRRDLPRLLREVRELARGGRLLRLPGDPPEPRAADAARPRGSRLHGGRDLPGRAEPPPRGARRRSEPPLRDRRAADAARVLWPDDGRVAPPPPRPGGD